MNQWIEVLLQVDGESAEAITEILQRYGHQGVVMEQIGIPPDRWDETEVPAPEQLRLRAYFPADDTADEKRLQLEQALAHMNMMYPMPQPQYAFVNEDDWAEAWKAHYKPLRLGKNILIRPQWIELKTNDKDIEIALDPGMAFGTGTHPTTQLCLEALEDVVQPGVQVLDLGCGSGILSIACAKLNAQHVLALDIDPIAVKATHENAIQNQVVNNITTQVGSLETIRTSARRFDLVVVNILAKVILQLCTDGLGDVVRPGGKAIFSGIIDEQVSEVEDALRNSGLVPTKQRQQGDWVMIEAKRPHD